MNEKTACILDGGAADGPPTASAVDGVLAELGGRGWKATVHTMRDLDVESCRGCFACWVKTPGVCIIDDVGREIARSVVQSELVVFVTPVTFGGYSSELKKGVDRLIPLILPYFTFVGREVHHIRRYVRYPSLLGVGVLPGPDEELERIFDRLVHRNSINMHAPDSDACFLYERDESPRQKIADALEVLL